MQHLQQRKVQMAEDMRLVIQATEETRHTVLQVLQPVIAGLEEAQKQLRNVRKIDICEVKAYCSPPLCVQVALRALCIMFEIRPEDWSGAKRLLGEGNLMCRMMEFDKDNIPEKVIRKLGPILQSEDFTPDRLKRVSFFCSAVCIWIHSFVAYHRLLAEVGPVRRHLVEQEKELEQFHYKQKVTDEVLSDLMAQKSDRIKSLS